MLAVALAFVVMSPPADPLLAGFKNPPLSARPHTWWHWMNGNVTKEGITADLEAMKQVGIGGAQMFTVDQGIPAGPAGYNSKLWRELTVFAIQEAHRLGIELCIHNCAGWSSSGGPWIKPEDAMQVLGWSTKTVDGGEIDVMLDPVKAPQVVAQVNYSKDIAVYAIPGDTKMNPVDLGKTGVVRQDGIQLDLTNKTGLPKSQVQNLTENFKDGRLQVRLPAGKWTILRLGHVPTGKNNHPAPPEGDGLEVDKMSKEAVKKHWDGMMAKVIAEAGPLAGKSLNNSLIDSYEVGGQNWTPKFREEFRRLRGYDPLPYMPALMGVTIESGDITERFLWDYRRTIADLFSENYFAYFGSLCRQNGMLFSTEPYGNGGFDNIQAGGTSDIPMGEFWIGGGMAMETTKLASSVGHVYGRPVIGAEAFTADESRGAFLEHPYAAKAIGDLAFVNGINRYIFHRYAMQPWTKYQPGMTMGPWGTHLERTQTWWTEAGTWMKYVARSQYLLQKGQFVADALVYTGESAPVDLPYARGGGRIVPEGYDYDGCDTKILLSAVVQNGSIVLPSGMKYRLLILPQTTLMTPKVAQKIRSLVMDGAAVLGPKPTNSPSLVGYPASDALVAKIGDEVWGKGPVQKLGKGRVFSSGTAAEVLKTLKVAPDFSYKGAGAKLLHIHRKIGDADVYFVSNQKYQGALAEATFRVSGKQLELWHPDTGKTELAPIWTHTEGGTKVGLRLQPAESVFVIFRGKPTGSQFESVTHGKSKAVKEPVITIVSARYESADGRGADVLDKVRELVKQGNTEIEATNGNFGDPVYLTVKRLNVEYKIDGKTFKASVPENGSLTLGTNTPTQIGDYDLEATANGVRFYPWQPGEYKLKGRFFQYDLKVGVPTNLSTDLTSNWNVSFAPKLGAPATATFAKLIPWNSHKDTGIKYFSGSAVYTKTFSLGSSHFAKAPKRVRLDLGDVKNFATVTLNGKNLGTLWKPPFVLDVTSAVKPGDNKLEVKVTNLWVNRIIGDEQLPPDVEWNGTQLKAWPEWLVKDQPRPKTGRITFSTWKYWDKNSPLLDSGLIGPVKVMTSYGITLNKRG